MRTSQFPFVFLVIILRVGGGYFNLLIVVLLILGMGADKLES